MRIRFRLTQKQRQGEKRNQIPKFFGAIGFRFFRSFLLSQFLAVGFIVVVVVVVVGAVVVTNLLSLSRADPLNFIA